MGIWREGERQVNKWKKLSDKIPPHNTFAFITDGKTISFALYGKKERLFLGCGLSTPTWQDWNHIPFEPIWWLEIPQGVDFGSILESADTPWKEAIV